MVGWGRVKVKVARTALPSPDSMMLSVTWPQNRVLAGLRPSEGQKSSEEALFWALLAGTEGQRVGLTTLWAAH